ncbi:hypothetical protein DCO45_19465 [Comamonas sp. JNW]|nr:hypothetical protein DCO45_19465 [Comamonas sp. JNW]
MKDHHWHGFAKWVKWFRWAKWAESIQWAHWARWHWDGQAGRAIPSKGCEPDDVASQAHMLTRMP